MKPTKTNLGKVRPTVEGDWDITREYSILSIVGVLEENTAYISVCDVPAGVSISDRNYWYPFQLLTGQKGDTGEKGDKGDPGATPMLRWNSNRNCIEQSLDGGNTWEQISNEFVNDFHIRGYVSSVNKLPKNAVLGAIYGVGPVYEENDTEHLYPKYQIYVNTVNAWNKVFDILKTYESVDELPSSAKNNCFVLVKKEVDNYCVFKYSDSLASWSLVVNTAEIYASETDIINRGDNIYALVLAEQPNVYYLYQRQVNWVNFGTYTSVQLGIVSSFNEQENLENFVPTARLVDDSINAAKNEAIEEALVNTQNLISDAHPVIDNNEYLQVITDSDDKLIAWIKTNGEIGWSKGIPEPIQTEFNKFKNIISNIVGEDISSNLFELDEYINNIKEIFEFLNGIRDNETLLSKLAEINVNLENKELDIESLNNWKDSIDTAIRENPEYLQVITDSDNKVLLGIKSDGTVDIPKSNLGEFTDNSEFVYLITDYLGKILWGIKKNGSVHHTAKDPLIERVQNAINSLNSLREELNAEISNAVQDINSSIGNIASIINVSDNSEYISVVLDANGNFLSGTKPDGTQVFVKQQLTDVIDNSEYLHIVLDAHNNIIESISKKGKRYLHQPTNQDDFLQEQIDDINNTFADRVSESLGGFGADGYNFMNWSNSDNIKLNIPKRYGLINFILPNLPTKKASNTNRVDGVNSNLVGYIEVYDMEGNYFKKAIIANAQGDSSLNHSNLYTVFKNTDKEQTIDIGKNIAIDIFETIEDAQNEYLNITTNSKYKTKTSKITFGNWIPQDSFHIKKYYIDVFRGQCLVGYKLHEAVIQTRPYGERYPWDYVSGHHSTTDVYNGKGDIKKDFDTGALAHPDGFPVLAHYNGEYIGIYTINLKKHRDNYKCKKDNYSQIILDGELSYTSFWFHLIEDPNDSTIKYPSSIDWTKFEVRNPKSLKDTDGNKYDGDNPKELSSTDANSLITKQCIERLSYCTRTEDHFGDNNNVPNTFYIPKGTGQAAKDAFEECFDKNLLIDYFLTSNVIYHVDGFAKNWIWVTLDGQHWSPTVYDMDSIFGSYPASGAYIAPYSDNPANNADNWNKENNTPTTLKITNCLLGLDSRGPIPKLWQCYKNEIKARYAELRNKGIFSVEYIIGLLEDWIKRIGYDNIDQELKLFKNLPSYRASHINTENWELVKFTTSAVTYNPSTTYNKGNTCVDGGSYKYLFKCIKDNTTIPPFNNHSNPYNERPDFCGYFNSIQRVKNWLTNRLAFLDRADVFDYTENNN